MKKLSEIIKENEQTKKYAYKLNVTVSGIVNATSESNAGEAVDQIVDTMIVQDGQVDNYNMISLDEIKNEGGYINPDLAISVNESEEKDYKLDYINNNGLKAGIFNNVEEMKAHIDEYFQNALDTFVSKHKIETPLKYSIDSKNNVIFEGPDITDPKEFGIFAHVIKAAKINSFNSSKLEGSEYKEQFYCRPYLWFTVSLSYEHQLGGSNGSGYLIDGEKDNSLYYYFDDKTIYTRSEAKKKHEYDI